jgi:hypothetical protein
MAATIGHVPGRVDAMRARRATTRLVVPDPYCRPSGDLDGIRAVSKPRRVRAASSLGRRRPETAGGAVVWFGRRQVQRGRKGRGGVLQRPIWYNLKASATRNCCRSRGPRRSCSGHSRAQSETCWRRRSSLRTSATGAPGRFARDTNWNYAVDTRARLVRCRRMIWCCALVEARRARRSLLHIAARSVYGRMALHASLNDRAIAGGRVLARHPPTCRPAFAACEAMIRSAAGALRYAQTRS